MRKGVNPRLTSLRGIEEWKRKRGESVVKRDCFLPLKIKKRDLVFLFQVLDYYYFKTSNSFPEVELFDLELALNKQRKVRKSISFFRN